MYQYTITYGRFDGSLRGRCQFCTPLITPPTTSPKRGESCKTYARSGRMIKARIIAEYAVMLAVILVIVVGTIRLIGFKRNNVFSPAGSSLNN